MKNRIQKVIESYFFFQLHQPIIIAVSGGSDSIALLHLLSRLVPDVKRIAVYINHGLRPLETDAEKALVESMAKKCSAEFVHVQVDVAGAQQEHKTSLEETARNLRYQALEKIRAENNAQCIAVGHTCDDQAEEVLLRLIRGTGSAGLAGMSIQYGYVVRPLLFESKENLRDYLREQQINYCEDSSNTDTRFLRNRVRHHLLPILEQEYNPSIRSSLLQCASILQEENDFLEELTTPIFHKICKKETGTIRLQLPLFFKEHTAIQRKILEKTCWEMGVKPSYKQIVSLQQLCHSQGNAEIHLSRGLRAIKHQDTMLFRYPSSDPGYRGSGACNKPIVQVTIAGTGNYPVPELGFELLLRRLPFTETLLKRPDCLLLDIRNVTFPLTLRSHAKTDIFHPLGAPGRKKVARFLSDQKIPATCKSNHPVLLSGEKVIAVINDRIDEQFKIQANCKECLLVQWEKTDKSNLLVTPI